MRSLLQFAVLLAVPAFLLGDGVRIPPCCLVSVQARADQAHKARIMQGQEHHPGSCNNYRQNQNPCKCHNALECPNYDDQGREIPRGEDPVCQQYCDKNDCHCISPCDS